MGLGQGDKPLEAGISINYLNQSWVKWEDSGTKILNVLLDLREIRRNLTFAFSFSIELNVFSKKASSKCGFAIDTL